MSKDPVPFELTPQDVEPLAEAAPEEVRPGGATAAGVEDAHRLALLVGGQ